MALTVLSFEIISVKYNVILTDMDIYFTTMKNIYWNFAVSNYVFSHDQKGSSHLFESHIGWKFTLKVMINISFVANTCIHKFRPTLFLLLSLTSLEVTVYLHVELWSVEDQPSNMRPSCCCVFLSANTHALASLGVCSCGGHMLLGKLSQQW